MTDLKVFGIQPERIKALNNRQIGKGSYVLYWMQASRRSQYNHDLGCAAGFWKRTLYERLRIKKEVRRR